MDNDSVKSTFVVAFLLCLVCSVLVSSAAVLLKEKQSLNQKLDLKQNMLRAAGLLDVPKPTRTQIEETFSRVTPAVVNLKNGEMTLGQEASEYDVDKARKDPNRTQKIPSVKDLAKIKMREMKSKVYMVLEDNKVKLLILPVRGKGLWSTLWGFMALEGDLKTVRGFAFYKHGETPGLGGEVDNPRWKASWKGKVVYGDQWLPRIEVIKGRVKSGTDQAKHQVDGLSGATITANGVTNLLRYWLGENGFGPFIKKLASNNMSVQL